MKDVSDPQRLRSAAARGSLLERGLTTARSRGPTDAELSALTASLFGGAALGGAPWERPAGSGTGSTTTAGSAGWRTIGLTKAATVLVVASTVAGMTAVGWKWTRATRTGRRTASASLAERRGAPEIVPLAPSAIPTPARSERRPLPAAAVSPHPRATRVPAPASIGVVAKQSGAEADEELMLLGEAQRALPNDPDLALAFVREHERLYPDGLLGQEREVVAVSALWGIGRRDEARQRAERFAEEHPRSTYVGRMRRVLAETGGASPTDKQDHLSPSTVGGTR